MQYVQNATSEQTEMFLDYSKTGWQPYTAGILVQFSLCIILLSNNQINADVNTTSLVGVKMEMLVLHFAFKQLHHLIVMTRWCATDI